jgi:hypothetical protein
MLSPLWLSSGWAGAFLLRGQRRKPIDPRTFESSFLVIPIIVGLIEPAIPVPHDQVLLTRTIVVHATPAEIWPFAVSNRSIGADEGRWTITHNVIGLPRPSATTIVGAGVGAVRTAYWGRHINFEEDITEWAPGRRLGWRFAFNNSSLQDYTDQHISPDGAFLRSSPATTPCVRSDPTRRSSPSRRATSPRRTSISMPVCGASSCSATPRTTS